MTHSPWLRRGVPWPRSRAGLVSSVVLLAFAASGCGQGAPTPGEGGAAKAPTSAAATPEVALSPTAPPSVEEKARSFGELVNAWSEPDGPFISDNIVSNETSYLQVATALTRQAQPGGVYVGVGPEQNFTYLALTRPRLAIIVDIRRQNLLLHLLYRALFEQAATRSEFLALLLGRPQDPSTTPGPGASIGELLAHAERRPPDEAFFAATHARLRESIERYYPLDLQDRKGLEASHRAFFRGQLATHFQLDSSGRRYPALRELLAQQDPDGAERGFLASEEAFRFVQAMEREGRVLPVVGDFAGERALPAIASYLKERHLTVSVFYVSNVEQYLFAPKVWPRWSRNVAALPTDARSLFVRTYLDEGRRHPAQLPGHRSATLLQLAADFEAEDQRQPYASFWSLVTRAPSGTGPALARGRTPER